ncbi:hypothetical protein BD410DRAFT_79307 [Rickenella mellea]|uniref:cAMP-independent regulatory protein pac2 n=1 Tax=Rickenella mellea TaxID=50990 RepID=A0A4Y7PKH9_9AGAM|nr:hypothetical protein BD410DRAFT_79307 [Rickenella mellea]
MLTTKNDSYATHPALHLRHAADAHVVFEAVRRGILPLIKRRLTAEERDHLSSGNVYVWEEAEHKGGLERWTDGRRWSQSRMKGDYLFYEEKVETTQEEKEAKAARRANKTSGPISQPIPVTRRQDRPSKPDGLTKQTYSTHVYIPGAVTPRKWHIVAYFSGTDYTRLPVIENYNYLRDIRVPDGIFVSSKGMVRKTDRYSLNSPGAETHYRSSSVTSSSGSYELQSPYPSPGIPPQREPRSPNGNMIPSSPTSPHQFANHSHHHSSHIHPRPERNHSRDATSLPRLSTIAPVQGYSQMASPVSPTHPGSPSGQIDSPHSLPRPYHPLSSEDRRALNTFRVVL